MRTFQLVVGGLIVLVALVLTGVGCGGGGGEPEVEDQLRQMVLQLEDLPWGVIQAEELFMTNEESAAESDDFEGRLAKLAEWGRILGYDVTYQANPEVMSGVGLILVNSTASLYTSEGGASASFADAVQTARTTDWAARIGGAYGVEVEELAGRDWVDEMFWLRITAKAQVGEDGEEETLANDIIIFRQGPARASLMAGWVMGREGSDLMEQLAEAQAQHLKDALP